MFKVTDYAALNELGKIFFATSLINSIVQEHEC